MSKVILLTGATDGIGQETAKRLAAEGHTLLLHGRDLQKLEALKKSLQEISKEARIHTFAADFSVISQVKTMSEEVKVQVGHIDTLINNAGLYVTSPRENTTPDGYDVRFVVNTFAPYILTKKLMPLFNEESRIVNISSAAQAPVDFAAIENGMPLSQGDAYAQSKLALIMWGFALAEEHPPGPSIIALNPKSFLGSKMVKQAYNREGYSLDIGADIEIRAAVSNEFDKANGLYFDNDYGVFSQPHPAAYNKTSQENLIALMDSFL